MASRRSATRRKAEAAPAAESNPWTQSWLDEFLAVVALAIAIFLAVSFLSFFASYDETFVSRSHGNLMGPIGDRVGKFLAGVMGWCGLVPALCALWLSVYFWRLDSQHTPTEHPWKDRLIAFARGSMGLVGVVAFSCVLTSVLFGSSAGGALGTVIAQPLERWFNTPGAILISGALFLVSLGVVTQLGVATHRIISGNRSLEIGHASRLRSRSNSKTSVCTRGGKSACDCGVQRPQGAMKPLRLRSARSSWQPPVLFKTLLAHAPSCGLPRRVMLWRGG